MKSKSKGPSDWKEYPAEVNRIVDSFSLMDDDFMSRMFDENIPATELLIRAILQADVEIVSTKGQWDLKNPKVGGRNIRLDVYAKDSEGKDFDCEVQKDGAGASPRRARFHSSMMDARMLDEGQKYTELKDSYVIFITDKDYFKKNRPIYRIERKQEEGEAFEDGSHILYVNGEYNGDDELGHLIKDFKNKGTTGFFNEELAKGVHHFKVDKDGREIMCEAVEQYAEKRRKEGREEGREEGRNELIKNLLSDGRSPQQIADFCKFPMDLILKVQKSVNAV